MPEAWRDPARAAAASGEGMQQPASGGGGGPTEEVSQVATLIGAVVGSKGSDLRHLRETSGCAVEVPREEDAYGNRHVKLKR